MQICAPHLHVLCIPNAMIRKPSLPDRKTRSKTMREAALDEADCSLQCDALRSQNQVYVIRHDNKCMQFVMAEAPVMLKSVREGIAMRPLLTADLRG